MKKLTILLSVFAFCAGLIAATPVADGLALYNDYNALVSNSDARLKAAVVSGDRISVATVRADRAAAISAWRTAHLMEVQALVPAIDDIAAANPTVASWVIRYTLASKNLDPATGKGAAVFDQNEADAALARKLLEMGTGSHAYFYIQYYASVEDLNSLPASSSVVVYAAALKRAQQLDVYADFAPSWNVKHLGQGVVNTAYVVWFNRHVKAIARTDKNAAIDLLANEQTAVSLLKSQTAATNKRIEELRKQIALLKEVK